MGKSHSYRLVTYKVKYCNIYYEVETVLLHCRTVGTILLVRWPEHPSSRLKRALVKLHIHLKSKDKEKQVNASVFNDIK